MARAHLLVALLAAVASSCRQAPRPLAPRTQTFAELRTIRRGVMVVPPGDTERAPYARERLVDGERVRLAGGGLAWLRRDGGETLLIAGPGLVELTRDELVLHEGKIFVDAAGSALVELGTPRGKLHLAGVRASLDVGKDGSVRAYVLGGALRAPGGAQAGPGEELTLTPDGTPNGKATTRPVLAWEDWTGGLATTDQAAQPGPYGVGTVGARTPGAQGQPRFPLAIQRLEVRVKIDHDFALTEVEEVFFNPSPDTVEGIYTFRAPPGAALHRFGVDRDGRVVWGRVKEKQAAAAQYQAHVYQGSTEDPALLEWDAPGLYKARLYPIPPGSTRRVVTRYGEWLGRQGDRGERRLYVYPMAAEGAEGTIPTIEELSISVDLQRAGAREIRSGMLGVREGPQLTVRAHDLQPRADFALELIDDGSPVLTAYQAPHSPDLDALPLEERARAVTDGEGEADYVLVPARPPRPPAEALAGGIDLAIVVDASAATQPGALAVARSLTQALLAHLGPDDRVAIWAGDAALRPVAEGSGALAPVDRPRREAISAGLARLERGGATDLAAVVAEAAQRLDPARRGAVVYLGDGQPTVGELAVADIRARLERLPRPVRLFAVGTGDGANMAILNGIARGAFAERVSDGNAAARAALRLLEEVERPAWLGVQIDLGLGVERVYPRELGAIEDGDSVPMVGRVVGASPSKIRLRAPGTDVTRDVVTMPIDDDGDLRRRWAEGRLVQLLDEGAGRAAVVEIGARYGIITPFTSLYVPTTNEAAQERARLKASEATAEAQRVQTGKARRGLFDGLTRKASRSSDDGVAANEIAPAAAAASASAPAARAEGGEATPKKSRHMGAADTTTVSKPSTGAGRSVPPGDPLSGFLDGASDEEFERKAPDVADRPMPGGNAPRQQSRPSLALADKEPSPEAASPPSPSPTAAGAKNGLLGPGAPAAMRPATLLPKADKAAVDALVASLSAPLAKSVSADLGRGDYRRASVEPGRVTHTISLCGPGGDLPLEDRRALWRERLAAAGRSVHAVREVYRGALARCEAPTWRERSALLYMMLDALPRVRLRVELWRAMFDGDLGGRASDLLYPAIVLRLRTPEDVREFHEAVGLRRIDPDTLEKLLRDLKSPAERVKKLEALVAVWPHDLDLAVRLLEQHEDAGDEGGGRAWARKLRRRGDADARVRTAVGEHYLRLARKPGGSPADEAEARRTFGEIVEYSPDDPVARRRLGDLCLAHGWYDEAFRHYETLARLAPQDTTVPLLLAGAAQGTGRVEEAIRWTERAGLASAPDAGSGGARVARAFARAFLAWAQQEAQQAGRADEAAQLALRARRIAGVDAPSSLGRAGTRVLLTWSHPDLHPVLWSNALGGMLPAPDGDPLLGVAQVMLPGGTTESQIEIRLERDDAARAARIGAEAVLTVVFDEGDAAERLLRMPVRFERPGGVVQGFTVGGGRAAPR
jgi:tetratricopeptide (TPR) repeat protein